MRFVPSMIPRHVQEVQNTEATTLLGQAQQLMADVINTGIQKVFPKNQPGCTSVAADFNESLHCKILLQNDTSLELHMSTDQHEFSGFVIGHIDGVYTLDSVNNHLYFEATTTDGREHVIDDPQFCMDLTKVLTNLFLKN